MAALWVVIYHLWRWDTWTAPAAVTRMVAAGPLAVTFFFVLSGFILVYAYTDDHGELRTTTARFFRARFARIYPVYLLGLVIAFPVVVALWRKAGADPGAFRLEMIKGIAAAGLVQSWVPDWALAWNPPAWSIAVEASFYALFPWGLRPLAKRTAAQLAGLATGLWVLSLLPSVAYLAWSPDGLDVVDHRTHAFWIDALKYHPLARLPELLMGMCAGALFVQSRSTARPEGAVLGLVVAGVVIASGVVPYALLHNGLLAPAFVLVVWGLTAVRRVPRLAVWLGESSYALYILHVPVLFWIVGWGQRRHEVDNILERPGAAAAAAVACVALSGLVYRAFESPLRRRLRGRRPVEEPDAAP